MMKQHPIDRILSKCLLLTVTLLISCVGSKSGNEEVATDSTDQTVQDPAQIKTVESKAVPQFENLAPTLSTAYLSKSSFITEGLGEFIFSSGGQFIFSDPVDFEERYGTWSLSGSLIVITFEGQKGSFGVSSLTTDELTLTTSDALGKKLSDSESTEENYSLQLHRTYLKPYTRDQVSGEWKQPYGKADFGPAGSYQFTGYDSATCSFSGTWSFSEGYIGLEIAKTECGSSQPLTINYDIVRVAPFMLVLKTEEAGFDVYTRDK